MSGADCHTVNMGEEGGGRGGRGGWRERGKKKGGKGEINVEKGYSRREEERGGGGGRREGKVQREGEIHIVVRWREGGGGGGEGRREGERGMEGGREGREEGEKVVGGGGGGGRSTESIKCTERMGTTHTVCTVCILPEHIVQEESTCTLCMYMCTQHSHTDTLYT